MTLHEQRLSRQPYREPAPVCATKECTYSIRTDLELTMCQGCKKRFCGDCIDKTNFAEPYCATCAVCKTCGSPADKDCAACGDLCCSNHLKLVHSREQGADQEDLVCKSGCDCGPAEVVAVGNNECTF